MVKSSVPGTSTKQDAKFAVIGLGRAGQSLALALLERGCNVLGIDRDALLVQRLSSKLPCVVLDATDEAALREVNVSAFDTAIVAIRSDFESNLLATVALKRLGVRQVIALAAKDYQREILTQAGADRVVEPESDAGRRLARELTAPDKREQIAVGASHFIVALEAPPSLVGQTLVELLLSNDLEISVLAIQRGDASLVQPPRNTVLLDGDILVVLANNKALAAMKSLL